MASKGTVHFREIEEGRLFGCIVGTEDFEDKLADAPLSCEFGGTAGVVCGWNSLWDGFELDFF